MKLNISLNGFKKNHKNKKDQILYISKRCTNYNIVENLFRSILAEKNSFIFESVEKGKIKGRYTIIGLNPDKIWDINKNTVTVIFNGIKKKMKTNPLFFLNKLISKLNYQKIFHRCHRCSWDISDTMLLDISKKFQIIVWMISKFLMLE